MDHAEAARLWAVERYLLDQLGEPETSQYEEHYFDCPECAEEVEVCAALLANGRIILTAELPPLDPSDGGPMPAPDVALYHRTHRTRED